MFRYVEADRLRIWQIILLVFSVVWGVDYLIGPDYDSLHTVEQSMPLGLWGMLLMTFGLIGLIGELWMEVGRSRPPSPSGLYICRAENRWWPAFIAHAALCAICTGFAAAGAVEMITNEHFYGGRVAFGMFTFAVAHWVFAQRRKHVS